MKKQLPIVAGLALLVGLACQDSSVAPGGGAPRIVAGSSALAALGSVALPSEFTIQPSGSRINVADVFTVNFPANSVCDPAISGACVPITAPLKVKATVQVTNGRLWVDFTPHLTFVNSPDRKTWVTISTPIYAGVIKANRDYFRANKSLLRKFGLLFAPSIGARVVDQGGPSGDRSLNTRVSFSSGLLWRRILHFSGYSILTGEECEPDPEDPYCIETEGEPEEDEGGGGADP